MTQYPVSKEEREALIASQGSRCLICRHAFDDLRKAVVDHDHVSGEVRGVLCGRCNSAIGFFSEDPEALCAAAEYVVVHRSHLSAIKGYDAMRLGFTWDLLARAESWLKAHGSR